jgi:hypothetical protein
VISISSFSGAYVDAVGISGNQFLEVCFLPVQTPQGILLPIQMLRKRGAAAERCQMSAPCQGKLLGPTCLREINRL